MSETTTGPEATAEGQTASSKTEAGAKENGKSAKTQQAAAQKLCRQHGLPAVWMTSDGTCFEQENDARNHAKGLPDNTTIKVTTK